MIAPATQLCANAASKHEEREKTTHGLGPDPSDAEPTQAHRGREKGAPSSNVHKNKIEKSHNAQRKGTIPVPQYTRTMRGHAHKKDHKKNEPRRTNTSERGFWSAEKHSSLWRTGHT